MPRPRKFSLTYTTQTITHLYQDGHSPRAISKLSKLSRWIITERLEHQGVKTRPREEALDLSRYLKDEEEAKTKHQRCAWPNCENPREARALCEPHHEALAQHDDKTCAWPRCQQRGTKTNLCGFHEKRATGLITD